MGDLGQAMATGGTGRSGPASPNFGFLAEHDPLLVHYASQAERYVFEDPNTALINLRQFAEVLAKEAAARAGVYDSRNERLSEHPDEFRRTERGYGKAKRPQDYLDAFRTYILQHLNDLPALIVVTQRPRDLTRSQLRELRLALDQAGFDEARLRTAWRETTNQDIAASIVGHIRHVACGQPLVSHRERVQAAMQKILTSRPWTEPQRKWLQWIGKQLEQEIVVDREALDAGQFKEMGGYNRLNRGVSGRTRTNPSRHRRCGVASRSLSPFTRSPADVRSNRF